MEPAERGGGSPVNARLGTRDLLFRSSDSATGALASDLVINICTTTLTLAVAGIGGAGTRTSATQVRPCGE